MTVSNVNYDNLDINIHAEIMTETIWQIIKKTSVIKSIDMYNASIVGI